MTSVAAPSELAAVSSTRVSSQVGGGGFGFTATDLAELSAGWQTHRRFNLGYPCAEDLDWTPLLPIFGQLLNNAGDPFSAPGRYPMQTLSLERELIDYIARLLRAPAGEYRGYLTGGGTEATIAALAAARFALPGAIVITSAAAHYSVTKATSLLGLPLVEVGVEVTGEVDYTAFAAAVHAQVTRERRRTRVIVVANIGTTWDEAFDDVHRIVAILDDAGIPAARRWIHADAALAGLPLAMLDQAARPGFDIADGVHSFMFTGHKFLGLPMTCAALLIAPGGHNQDPGADVPYIGSRDVTITGSRPGHIPLLFAHALTVWPPSQLHARAEQSRDLAAYAVAQLRAAGIATRRNPDAFTVVFPTPPEPVLDRWRLPVHGSTGELSRILCMPGRTRDRIDAFVADVHAAQLGLPLPSLTTLGTPLALVAPRPRTSPEASTC